MVSGRLQIQIVEGRNLRDKDLFGKMDPYVIVQLGNQKFRTKTHKNGGKSPSWNETFNFNVADNMVTMPIVLTLMDDDIGADDFIGAISIPVNTLILKPFTDAWYTTLSKHNKPVGEIHTIVRFDSDAAAAGQMYPQQAPQQYNYAAPPQQQYYGQPPQQGYPPQQGGYPQQYPPVSSIICCCYYSCRCHTFSAVSSSRDTRLSRAIPSPLPVDTRPSRAIRHSRVTPRSREAIRLKVDTRPSRFHSFLYFSSSLFHRIVFSREAMSLLRSFFCVFFVFSS
eukprot:TRINITY_DN143_c0_g1_i8.p1 TRINITY_DN143_c0_g1~~TRINITY_DN143_c0_g1_i8.p1  ORF type:complete len:295 (-),score=52.98 TRINITY_DN143_c0_g1_i8:298-1140(-)